MSCMQSASCINVCIVRSVWNPCNKCNVFTACNAMFANVSNAVMHIMSDPWCIDLPGLHTKVCGFGTNTWRRTVELTRRTCTVSCCRALVAQFWGIDMDRCLFQQRVVRQRPRAQSAGDHIHPSWDIDNDWKRASIMGHLGQTHFYKAMEAEL